MIKLPGMLMIGSSGRDVGKTEFACLLIRRFGTAKKITGIKVTTIAKAGSVCPRGRTGCTACSALDGTFHVTEETDSEKAKDTSRMLSAGAARVFWIRSLKGHLQEAMEALLEMVGEEAVFVCESNSLRTAVEPGLFVMLKGASSEDFKQSAKKVLQRADIIASFDGKEFDVGIDEIELVNKRWASKIDATAIVLAGGESSRMGKDKSMLKVTDRPMIQLITERLTASFKQVLVSANDIDKYSFLNLPVIRDEVPGHGPLGGIAAVVKVSKSDVNFVIACDIGRFSMAAVREMVKIGRSCDAVIGEAGSNQFEPLFAVYNKSALPAIEQALCSGTNKITEAVANCNVKYLALNEFGGVVNINTMEDYEAFLETEGDVFG